MIADWVIELAMVLLGIAMLMAAFQAVLRKRTTDRAVASDLIFFGAIGFITLIALRIGSHALFDIILIATLLGFMAAISMARLGSGGLR